MFSSRNNVFYLKSIKLNLTTCLTSSGQRLLCNHLRPFPAQAGAFDWWWDVWRSEPIHPQLCHSSPRANSRLMKNQPSSALILSTVALAVWAPRTLRRARRAIPLAAPIGDYLYVLLGFHGVHFFANYKVLTWILCVRNVACQSSQRSSEALISIATYSTCQPGDWQEINW